MKALVTGGTGFIGRHLLDALLKQGASVTVLSRHPQPELGRRCVTVVGDLARPETIEGICRGIDTVFHLGGHAHAVDQPDDKYEQVNWRVTVEGTRALLAESMHAGVNRFLFFSSVKAMGEGGEARLDETAECRPVTAYGIARREAEKLVLAADRQTMLSAVLRLPMVYGPGSKGNLTRMIEAIARGRFPPLPEISNRRSMVDVRDVVQAALLAATSSVAAGKVYIVTDGQMYSTRQIYEWICAALQRRVPRWITPLFLLRVVAQMGTGIHRFSGRRFFLDTYALDKLISSAWYSSEKISRELGYQPVYSLEIALPGMIAEFRADR